MANDVLSMFSTSDLDEIENDINTFRMSWINVANCVGHEMYPKLASAIKSIINTTNHNAESKAIEMNDLSDKCIEQILEILKTKRNLAVEERIYLKELVQRARNFVPIDSTQSDHSDSNEDIDDKEQTIDFHVTLKGLNAKLLRDIYDIHRYFIFSNYHFKKYSVNDFILDIATAGNEKNINDLDPEFVKEYLLNACKQFRNIFNFHPEYIVKDSLFEIFDSLFGISNYVNYLRNNMQNMKYGEYFQLKCIVIPHSVQCVYDNKTLFHCDLKQIDRYLEAKGADQYSRHILRKTNVITKGLQNEYNIDDIKDENVKKMIIIIDRRHRAGQKDKLYLFPCEAFNDFPELNRNYCIGFDFDIISMGKNNNTVNAYLRFGVDEKTRFYAEMLESLIPRLFVKNKEMSAVDLAGNLYANNYKHGWAVNLNNDTFNKYYKIFTKFSQISVNYNRTILSPTYLSAKYILSFRDILEYEMEANNMNKQAIDGLNSFLLEQHYDSESIIDDIVYEPNIKISDNNIKTYFVSQNHQKQYHIIKQIVRKYTNPPQTKKSQCNEYDTTPIEECVHIKLILDALVSFKEDRFEVKSYKRPVHPEKLCATVSVKLVLNGP